MQNSEYEMKALFKESIKDINQGSNQDLIDFLREKNVCLVEEI